MLRLQKSIMIVLLLTLAACSQNPIKPSETMPSATFTPYVGGTETALASNLASPTPWVAGTETALAAERATPTPWVPGTETAVAALSATPTPVLSLTPLPTIGFLSTMPPNFSPILYGQKYDANTFFILLGGVDGSEWLTPDQVFARFAGAWEYDVYSFTGGSFHIHGHAPEISRISQSYFVDTDVTDYEFGMVGVAQGWQVMQRKAEELDPENQFYRQVVTDWLSQAGVADPQIGTIKIYRIDLEGDGSDEIFITSTRVKSDHTTETGDHSMLLMRKVVGNEAVTIPILIDLYAYVNKSPINPFPCTYSIGNFIDLNQDGVLDVVVEFQRWEGFGAAVYQVAGQNVSNVLGSTCITP